MFLFVVAFYSGCLQLLGANISLGSSHYLRNERVRGRGGGGGRGRHSGPGA